MDAVTKPTELDTEKKEGIMENFGGKRGAESEPGVTRTIDFEEMWWQSRLLKALAQFGHG